MGDAPRRSFRREPEPAGAAHSQPTTGSGRTILVVDDDADVTRLFGAVLASRGFRTISAPDPVQGFALAERQPPQLIVVDWHMPAGGGPEMLRRLREHSDTAAIPVVVVTGDSAPNLPGEATALGARLFLHKPIDPDRLVEVVGMFLGEGE